MDKCLFNGKLIYSFEVARNFETEKLIRESSAALTCCDPDCGGQVIYRHGIKRAPHFAHKSAGGLCAYDSYTRNTSELFRKIRALFYERFRNYDVRIDEKLIREPSHYTALTIYNGNKKYAVDIIDKTVTSTVLDMRYEKYRKLGFVPVLVIVDDVFTGEMRERTDFYYPVKFQLNMSKNHTAVVVDRDTMEVALYKLFYGNITMYKYVYGSIISLDRLELTADGFDAEDVYDDWLERRKAFELTAGKVKPVKKKDEPVKPVIISVKEKKATRIDYRNQDEFHRSTGRYVEKNDKGEYIELELSQITAKKPSVNRLGHFDEERMHRLINDAFTGNPENIRHLIRKMYYADDEEMEVFMSLFEDILNSDEPDAGKSEVLKHVLEQISS